MSTEGLNEIVEELGLKQTMRDGTNLASDVYRPNDDKRHPAILIRSPYLTVCGFYEEIADEARFFARNGYVYVIQDCRGKNDSDGIFDPFHDDGPDGYDTIEWIANQAWSDGKVGTIGRSYSGWNQWATAILNPPHLRAMVSLVALPDPVRNVPYQDGELILAMAGWAALVEGRRNTPVNIYDVESILWHLPVKDIDKKFGRNSKIWQDWVEHEQLDDYWRDTFYQDKLEKVDVPALHISGWFDDDLIGTYINYTTVANSPSYDKNKNFQKLILGPWPHNVDTTAKLGDVDFGPGSLIDLRNTELRFFDRFLKGLPNGVDNEPPVDIFMMGTNKWSKEPQWPPKDVTYKKYYLGSKGKANTLSGDGFLSEEIQEDLGNVDTYEYDPINPVPCISGVEDPTGNRLAGYADVAEAPTDQRPIEERNDVLVYKTGPLAKDTEVVGPVKLRLFVSSSSKDTDFWAQLTDIYPDGRSIHITENIIRCKYREGLDKPKLMEPGKVEPCDINLWITGNVFLKGHRIGLDISSSSFPKYARNLNTGGSNLKGSEYEVAKQKIHHGGEYLSHLSLPLREREIK